MINLIVSVVITMVLILAIVIVIDYWFRILSKRITKIEDFLSEKHKDFIESSDDEKYKEPLRDTALLNKPTSCDHLIGYTDYGVFLTKEYAINTGLASTCVIKFTHCPYCGKKIRDNERNLI